VMRALALESPSTALAFSMHTQAVAGMAWHWRHHHAPVTSILRRIVREQLAVATTNGSDWLTGSGQAARARGGFRIDAEKRLISAVEASDLLATNAIYEDPNEGSTVLHFLVPIKSPGLTIERNWKAMGMRGSGSQTVRIEGLLVSDRAIIARRPSNVWHPLYHVAVMIATPLIFSVYLGIAMAARDTAIDAVKRTAPAKVSIDAVGTMEAHLNTARMAVDDMLHAADRAPGEVTTNRIELARTLAGDSCIATVQSAVELAGGAAFMRGHPLEGMFRDVQAARFHPLTRYRQLELAGRLALGLPL